jgi:hypothetical protein
MVLRFLTVLILACVGAALCACSNAAQGGPGAGGKLELTSFEVKAPSAAAEAKRSRVTYELAWSGGEAPYSIELTVDGQPVKTPCGKGVTALNVGSPAAFDLSVVRKTSGWRAEHEAVVIVTDARGQNCRGSFVYSDPFPAP